MYFTNFNLKNIQKHKDLTLPLVNGLNIFHGDSGMGKTGVMRGLEWLYGEPQRSILRDGELLCSFAATRDDGVKIKRIKRVTRDKITGKIKSTPENRYEVYYPGEKEPEHYKKVNKTVPPKIAELLGKVELEVDGEKLLLDFTKQKEPYFFLGEKGSFRMKVLNKLTGSEVLDRTVHSYNRDITRINREKTILDKDLEQENIKLNDNKSDLEIKKTTLKESKVILDKIKYLTERNKIIEKHLKEIEINDNAIKEISSLIKNHPIINDAEIEKLKKLDIQIYEIKPLITRYSKLNENITQDKKNLSLLQVIDLSLIKELDIKVDKLSSLLNRYKSINNNINECQQELKTKKLCQIDIVALKELHNRVKTIKFNVLELTSKQMVIKTLETQKTTIQGEIKTNRVKIDELIKQGKANGRCPNCNYKL